MYLFLKQFFHLQYRVKLNINVNNREEIIMKFAVFTGTGKERRVEKDETVAHELWFRLRYLVAVFAPLSLFLWLFPPYFLSFSFPSFSCVCYSCSILYEHPHYSSIPPFFPLSVPYVFFCLHPCSHRPFPTPSFYPSLLHSLLSSLRPLSPSIPPSLPPSFPNTDGAKPKG